MNEQGHHILQRLQDVATERARRAADHELAERVLAVKRYQHDRFRKTYADMLSSARYGRAAQFFLDDLYGAGDFTQRDTQFARIVPGLVRLFPHEIIETVVSLGDLHALSERLDTAMSGALGSSRVDDKSYADAWRVVAQPEERERQIALMLAVGGALDRYTRNPLLRHSLRIMRGPARAAGVGVLQAFLENGFDTFREMRGAREFLETVATRERDLAARLFAGGAVHTPAATP
ncbi:MAG: hypothetical protein Q8K96_16410 [Rubrivivax sp.]|nr:hypothetical protein [Rubrivivax sp.]